MLYQINSFIFRSICFKFSFHLLFCFPLYFSFSTFCLANQEIKKIGIGSYNLHQMNNLIGLKSDFNDLKFIDIWAFQEVISNGSGDFIKLHEMLSSNYKYIYNLPVAPEPSNDSNSRWEGHAIASRFPILSTKTIPLNHTSSKKRVALATWILVNQQILLIINTDHENDYMNLGFKDRKKQLQSLLDGIKLLNFNGPSIILGDFNTATSLVNLRQGITSQKEVSLTYSFMNKNGWTGMSSESSEFYTFNYLFFYEQLDLIFLKNFPYRFNKLTWHRYDQRVGSDHYPIYFFAEF